MGVFYSHSRLGIICVSSCWSANIGISMCMVYPSLINPSLFLQLCLSMSCSSYLNRLWDERRVPVTCSHEVVFYSKFCSRQHTALLYNFHLAFSIYILFESMQYNHIATAWKEARFILSDKSDFHMIDILPIAFQTFAVDITFGRWDVSAEVCKQVHKQMISRQNYDRYRLHRWPSTSRKCSSPNRIPTALRRASSGSIWPLSECK